MEGGHKSSSTMDTIQASVLPRHAHCTAAARKPRSRLGHGLGDVIWTALPKGPLETASAYITVCAFPRRFVEG